MSMSSGAELHQHADMMRRRALSTDAGVESGSSFRMTQLLLPVSVDRTPPPPPPPHHDGAGGGTILLGRSQRCTAAAAAAGAGDLLPQHHHSSAPSTRHDSPSRQYPSPDHFSDAAWQTAIKFDAVDDYKGRLPQRYCSVYRNTDGQSLPLQSSSL